MLVRGCAVNPVRKIQAFNAGRDPERLQLKYGSMRADAFAFLRGTCHLFYERLPRTGVLKTAPLTWVCGDLHLQNFGSYKGDNRLVYFDVNDFDESVLAPASWDLVRFLASLRVFAQARKWPSPLALEMSLWFLESYACALAAGKVYWVERETAQGLVRELLDGLRKRARKSFLDARTSRKRSTRRLLVDGRHALPASRSQCSEVTDFIDGFAKAQPVPGFFEVLDVARRVAGTGSLGLQRYVVLVRGRGSPDGNYLLDLKQAAPSSLLPRLGVSQPEWKSEGCRVVALQRRIQAVSMAFLQPVHMRGQDFVLRELQPAEDRIALDQPSLGLPDLARAIGDMGRIVAWAHLRGAGREGSAIADELIEFGRRAKWRKTLPELARTCAAQVARDARAFNEAYDDGALND
jgi:uncharacterized protein (DUF2252 family)